MQKEISQERDLDFPLGFKILTKLGRERYILVYVGMNYIFMGLWSFIDHQHTQCPSLYIMIALFTPILTGIIILIIAFSQYLTKKIRLFIMIFMGVSSLHAIFGIYNHILKWQSSADLFPNISPIIHFGLMCIGLTAFIYESQQDKRAEFCPEYFGLPLYFHFNQIFGIIIGIGFLWTVGVSIFYHYNTSMHIAKMLPIAIGITSFIISIWAFRKKNLVFSDAAVFATFMALNIIIGLIGFLFHIWLVFSQTESFYEALLFRVPFLAPLMFVDMGILGIIYLLFQETGCDTFLEQKRINNLQQ